MVENTKYYYWGYNMDKYTLYLDESHTYDYNKKTKQHENPTFVIAGIIVKDEYHDTILSNKMDKLKCNIWNKCGNDPLYNDKILHELEMSRAITHKLSKLKNNYDKVFKNIHIYNFTYDYMTDIIKTSDITILGACIHENLLNDMNLSQSLNDLYSICMNIIIENYYHFLCTVNGIGSICYESMPDNQNKKVEKRYKYIRNTGTMFYPAKEINKRITSIEFKNKLANVVGLQIADFIPNSMGRYKLHKTYNNKEERNIPYSIIESKLYDGAVNNIDRFGLKIMP